MQSAFVCRSADRSVVGHNSRRPALAPFTAAIAGSRSGRRSGTCKATSSAPGGAGVNAPQLQGHEASGVAVQQPQAAAAPLPPPATAEAAAAAAAAAGGLDPATFQPHSIIQGVSADGHEVFLEVLEAPAADGSWKCAWKGVVYRVECQALNSNLQAKPLGWQLSPEDPLVQKLPGWSQQLASYQQRVQLPSNPLHLTDARHACSLDQLTRDVRADPKRWRDGTGPGDPPLQDLAYQTLCAGEVQCLLQRQRGVVMVQLQVGWDDALPQPVCNPLVLQCLRQVLACKDVSIFLSRAPGDVGLTAIVSAKAEPWRSWAAHLAGFGCQAALVADSPYYKLLIGRVLGYKEENVLHHIKSIHGPLAPAKEVVAEVEKELRKLSSKKPLLPWQGASTGAAGKKQHHQQQKSQQKRR